MSLNHDKVLAQRRMIINILNLESLDKCHNSLIELKNLNFSQNEVYEWLEELRSFFKNDDEIEDLILEILDIASGYCSPNLDVW